MITLIIKGETFQVPERFSEGQFPTQSEAEALNNFIQRNLRGEISEGRVATRLEAWEYILSDECLKPRPAKQRSSEDVTSLDVLEDIEL